MRYNIVFLSVCDLFKVSLLRALTYFPCNIIFKNYKIADKRIQNLLCCYLNVEEL